jgi:mono/diheme cytochrome c family protein
VLPNDGTPNTAAERIAWSEEGNWTFPVGTVLIQHFEVRGRRLETRFFLNGDDGTWFGFTYRWRIDGSNAELLRGEPVVETFTANGTTRTWHFPCRNEGSACHTDAAGKVLGVKTRHLNSDFFYAATGHTANQLGTLNRLGFFPPAINEAQLPAMLTSKKQDDITVSLERRARSYLDVNCSHCHQPAAPTQAAFDARLLTPPWFLNLINVTPGNSLGVSGARLVAPGSIDLSIVHRRAGSLAPGVAMPPVAKNLVDTAGMQLLTAWINSLDPAIGPIGSVTGRAPRDHSAPVLTLARTSGTGSVVAGAFSVTLSASGTIRGLTLPDITVTNATLSVLTDSGAAWSFTVTPAAPGAVTLALASDRVTDINGHANNPAAPATFTHEAGPVPGRPLTGGDFENGLSGCAHGGYVSVSTVAFRGTRAA